MSTFSEDPPLSTDSAHNYVTHGSINHPSVDHDSDFSFISDLQQEHSSYYQPPRPLSQPCIGTTSPLPVANERAIKSFELPTVIKRKNRQRGLVDDSSSEERSGMISPFTLPRTDASTSSSHSGSSSSSIMDAREYPSETRLRIERSLSNIRSMSRSRQHPSGSRDTKDRFKSLTTSLDTRLKVTISYYS